MATQAEKAIAHAYIAQKLEALGGFEWEQIPEANESELAGIQEWYEHQIKRHTHMAKNIYRYDGVIKERQGTTNETN